MRTSNETPWHYFDLEAKEVVGRLTHYMNRNDGSVQLELN